MKVQVGDRSVVESEKVAQPSREGVVGEVLKDDPARLRVRWDDGHSTILSPATGGARVKPVRRRQSAAS